MTDLYTKQLTRKRVRRGVTLLDAWWPDWRMHVNPARLSMSVGGMTGLDRCGCIGTQLDFHRRGTHGSYGSFITELRKRSGIDLGADDNREARRHGFDSDPRKGIYYRLLDLAWKWELA